MALTCRALFRNYNFAKPVHWHVGRNDPVRVLSSGICYSNAFFNSPIYETRQLNFISVRQCVTQTSGSSGNPGQEPEKKQGLIQRFRQMYKDYWYVLLPVHLCTSAVWFGSFYYAVRR